MIFDLAGLLRTLVEREVEFVVIGGIAVVAHAAIRATEDLDLVPDPEPANLDRLLDLLAGLDARLVLNPERGIDEEVRSSVHAGRNLTVNTKLGAVDVIQRVPGVPPYAHLRQDAEPVELHGARFLVASRAQLVAMKQARSSPADEADIRLLTED